VPIVSSGSSILLLQSHSSQQDVNHLQKQVLSLMGELTQAKSKRDASDQDKSALQEKLAPGSLQFFSFISLIVYRCSQLERKISDLYSQIKKTRDEDEALIQALRQNIKTLECKIQTQRSEIDVRM
jgi:chromosome segregation ATPase